MHERWNARRAHEDILEELRHQHWLLHKILERSDKMSAELDRLTTEVTETKSSVESVITLVDGLAQQIRDLANDPAALNALADELDAQQARIAAAVTANTPAPPEPPVEPVP